MAAFCVLAPSRSSACGIKKRNRLEARLSRIWVRLLLVAVGRWCSEWHLEK
ncbi:hypothetical protein IscW_ISCW000668 [Ixodes scapularis]|uniref:Uncharacterized protein n=1 Tax=Ixodes scapularis TaxID=6945 RepID=B7P580_IXOSC|nr:hypothetical protein IscW_ISCW000668 [Ixodes scapularis]|eukprot:XP_002407114.1 hypothetical protein IscW_ISCW000668 [Ixodes scapularis]